MPAKIANPLGIMSRRLVWYLLLVSSAHGALALPLLMQGGLPRAILWPSLVLVLTLTLLSAIDAESLRLPDVLTLPLILAGLVFTWLYGWDEIGWRVAAAVAGGLGLIAVGCLYQSVRGQAGLGFGDAKLFAASGAWLGLDGLPSVLLFACASALAGVVIAGLANRKIGWRSALPFGPFLAAGTWAVWLYGPLG